MMFAVIDKKTRETLCFGQCSMDSFVNQRGVADSEQQVVMIPESLNMHRKYKLWPDGELEDIGLSKLGEVLAMKDSMNAV